MGTITVTTMVTATTMITGITIMVMTTITTTITIMQARAITRLAPPIGAAPCPRVQSSALAARGRRCVRPGQWLDSRPALAPYASRDLQAPATGSSVTDAVGRVALPAAAPRFDSKWLLIGVPVALVVWLALVPLVFLLWQSFLTPQTAAAPAHFTLENFRTAYFSADTARLFFNSVQFAAGAAVLCARRRHRARLDERAHQHAVQDAVLRARDHSAGHPRHPVHGVVDHAGEPEDRPHQSRRCRSCSTPTPCSFNIYTMAGMIWVDGLHYSPMAFLLMTAAFRSMDPSLEESAR